MSGQKYPNPFGIERQSSAQYGLDGELLRRSIFNLRITLGSEGHAHQTVVGYHSIPWSEPDVA